MDKYGKTQGHHCWWLTKNGKSLANFDDEKEVDAIIELQESIENSNTIAFGVVAGKMEGHGEYNCKYSNDFETLDEAIKAYDEVSDYPWAYITYEGRYLDLFYKGFNPFN